MGSAARELEAGSPAEERVAALERYTVVDGVRTFSRTVGRGRDVLLIHGVGVSTRYWVPAQEALAARRRFRVHTLDFPGFGRSDTPPWPLTVPCLAEHLQRWVDAYIPEGLDLVGQSMGCEFAVLGALAMPDRVGRVVLAAPNGMPEQRGVLRQLFWAAVDAPREPLSLFAAILPDYWRCGLVRILRMLVEQREDRTEELLPRVRQPVLLVRGEADPVVKQPRLERIARKMANAKIRTIAGAHGAHFSHADEFADAVGSFLATP